MAEYIDRQAALDALDKRFNSIPMEQTTEILLLRKDLRNLPSAQPERKTGRWIKMSDADGKYYACSECGEDLPRHIDRTHYCPNCGADLRVNSMDDTISRKEALNACKNPEDGENAYAFGDEIEKRLKALPSAQPERLTDDDFETIRIHLNAYKGELCNQRRWEEAEEYQRIIDRFMAFASAQPYSTAEIQKMQELESAQLEKAYEIGRESAQSEIIRCKDCKYHDEGYRRISVKWLPCMDICPGSNWYCGSAERREE